MNEAGFLIEVQLRLVQLKNLQRNGKWLKQRGNHQKKSGRRARYFLLKIIVLFFWHK